VSTLPAVAAAALIGFVGNELVARYRIRVGRKIGSAALVADGLHARTDGFTSLAVLLGVAGVAVGWNWADPVVGLLITVAILAVLRQAAREIYWRLMDAVDPSLVDQAGEVLRGSVWRAGHRSGPAPLDRPSAAGRMRGDRRCQFHRDPGASQVAVSAEHNLLHALPQLTAALVHADPQPRDGEDQHAELMSHR